MKRRVGILIYCFLHCNFIVAQQGSTCSNPYPLLLDGVSRNFVTSASTGNSVVCGYANSTPITFFSITTNGSAECVLLSITAPTAQPCEIAMYAGGSCTGGNLQSSSSMCFDDGQGVWAPSETYVLTPNTTYILRIKTTTVGSITISGQHYSPPNDNCLGAMSLGPIPVTDNNACHTGGPGVIASQLCAFSLENTSFYKYTVASNGTSTINITSIECDNGSGNNSNGFQIGFFTGTCSSLSPLTCASNSGSAVSATTSTLPAGTGVFVAVDGVSGSNCRFQISVTNSLVLAAYIKYFSAWKNSNSNILRWTSLQEFNNDRFEIQRSENGRDFLTIGTLAGEMNSSSEKNYSFEDSYPPEKCFYRLKMVDIDGNIKYHNTISVIRSVFPYVYISFQNPVTDHMLINMQTNVAGKMNIQLISMNGSVVYSEDVFCKKGDNVFYRRFDNIPIGRYQLIVFGDNVKASKSLLKTSHNILNK